MRTNLVTDGWTGGRTDAGNDNTRRPKLASGNKTQFFFNNSVSADTFETKVTSEYSIHENKMRLACLMRSLGKPVGIKDMAWAKDGRKIFHFEDKYDTDNFDLVINVSSAISCNIANLIDLVNATDTIFTRC